MADFIFYHIILRKKLNVKLSKENDSRCYLDTHFGDNKYLSNKQVNLVLFKSSFIVLKFQ